nr:MAG TPA: hypothetical protein [Caudoviricetes sp.]
MIYLLEMNLFSKKKQLNPIYPYLNLQIPLISPHNLLLSTQALFHLAHQQVCIHKHYN